MVLEAIIPHKNKTSEVYGFKVDQKCGTPSHYITAQIWLNSRCSSRGSGGNMKRGCFVPLGGKTEKYLNQLFHIFTKTYSEPYIWQLYYFFCFLKNFSQKLKNLCNF